MTFRPRLLATQGAILSDAINSPYPVRAAGGATVGKMRLRFLYPAKDGYVSITHVFGDEAQQFTAALAATRPARGFDAVLVPGEIERRTRARRAQEGVPLPAATWSELAALKGGARA